LRKRLRRGDYRITFDRAFAEVILGCARPDRPGATGPGTWITASMAAAYRALHELGYAHSVECWRDDELVGGLYGISLGRLFFGESMFSRTDDASKVALVHLARRLHAWQFPLIDCQIQNPHLQSLGAVTISRRAFLHILADNSAWPDRVGSWTLDDDIGNEQ
jgi:leucyl/phenylalanyl-tRNA--protein transferase